MRWVSRYYQVRRGGVSVYVRPTSLWRKIFRQIPNLTGDFVPIDIIIDGVFDKSVQYIKVLYDYNGFKYDESPKYSPQGRKYTFQGKRLSDSGSYKIRLLIGTDKSEVQELLWASEPEIAVIQVIDDWKPTVWLATVLVSAVAGAIVTLLVQWLF